LSSTLLRDPDPGALEGVDLVDLVGVTFDPRLGEALAEVWAGDPGVGMVGLVLGVEP